MSVTQGNVTQIVSVHTSLSVHSLASNYICSGGMEGLNAIIAVLPKLPHLSVLK